MDLKERLNNIAKRKAEGVTAMTDMLAKADEEGSVGAGGKGVHLPGREGAKTDAGRGAHQETDCR